MAPKRPRDDDASGPLKKKQKKGFSVGPANLPDGTYKRKVQKIKKDLIHKAKLKKQYAKLKAREEPAPHASVYDREDADVMHQASHEPVSEPNLEPHPERLKMLEEGTPEPAPVPAHSADQRRKRSRRQPFEREVEYARQKNEEADSRQRAREEAEKERVRKLAERERFRKTMAKARKGGPNGQRKLGRESTVLLEKAKRLVGRT